jgi:hypothetical protein
MNQTAGSSGVYRSFDEFRRMFYPEWSKNQDSRETDESFGRDMAKYAVEKHFPFRAEIDQGNKKGPFQGSNRH